jgi:hypothetical protein
MQGNSLSDKAWKIRNLSEQTKGHNECGLVLINH